MLPSDHVVSDLTYVRHCLAAAICGLVALILLSCVFSPACSGGNEHANGGRCRGRGVAGITRSRSQAHQEEKEVFKTHGGVVVEPHSPLHPEDSGGT